MPRITYVPKNFADEALEVIDQANVLCADYATQGYDLTLRQLYYLFVAQDLFPGDRTWREVNKRWVRDPNGTKNAEPNYKWLGGLISDARLAGVLDWKYIVDRTRKLEGAGTQDSPHWGSPEEIIDAAARGYRIDKWREQPTRVEVWIEKDALKGVLESCCPQEDVAYFSCRGYTSSSELWVASQRMVKYIKAGQRIVILHLGDHDPSGIDMTRDIRERLATFIAQDARDAPTGWDAEEYEAELDEDFQVERIALNMDQIRQYNPPPNPAKVGDSRAKEYIRRFGDKSWELDALEPRVLVALVRRSIDQWREEDKWKQALEREEDERVALTATSERWEDVKEFVTEDAE